jgi:hypothetical protein
MEGFRRRLPSNSVRIWLDMGDDDSKFVVTMPNTMEKQGILTQRKPGLQTQAGTANQVARRR